MSLLLYSRDARSTVWTLSSFWICRIRQGWSQQACLCQSRLHHRDNRALPWLLFTETCLWAIQTHQILKAWSFHFTHWEGGVGGTTERRTHRGGGGEGKVKRTVGLGGNNTSGTLGGGHMSRDGGRERRTGREHPKVRQGESECLCLIRCSSWV